MVQRTWGTLRIFTEKSNRLTSLADADIGDFVRLRAGEFRFLDIKLSEPRWSYPWVDLSWGYILFWCASTGSHIDKLLSTFEFCFYSIRTSKMNISRKLSSTLEVDSNLFTTQFFLTIIKSYYYSNEFQWYRLKFKKSPDYFKDFVLLDSKCLAVFGSTDLGPCILSELVCVLVVVAVREIKTTLEVSVALIRYREIGPASKDRTIIRMALNSLLTSRQSIFLP